MKAIGRRRKRRLRRRRGRGYVDRAGIERVDAGENLDQRRLAGAVLAEQRDDFAGADVDARVGRAPACRRTASTCRAL